MSDSTAHTAHASVQILGRLGAATNERTLPSGDRIVTFSVIVDRPARERRGRTGIDTIACVATTSAVINRLARLEPGTVVAAEGVLRRRFWRSGSGLGSAMEVEVRRLRREASPAA